MNCKMHICGVIFLLLCCNLLKAQTVLYSPYVGNQFSFQVAGKAGNYYWIQKEKRRSPAKRHAVAGYNKEQSFEVYDNRMNLVQTIPSLLSDGVLKQYFVSNNRYFDKVVFTSGHNSTRLLLDRYSAEGDLVVANKVIGCFPFTEHGNGFLMARSEDKNTILLLGLEPIPSSPPRFHAILFNRDWKQLFYTIYQHPFITQPLIQDDFTSYPIEHFNNSPVKLANNGQWVMVSPSRRNHNYSLFHFNCADTGIVYKEIKLPSSSVVEDIAVSVSDTNDEVYAGILSRFRYRAVKNVQVVRYSLINQKLDFDSSYRFKTLGGDKVKNQNLIKESFVSVPGKGFMLLKEHGRVFTSPFDDDDITYKNEIFFSNNLVATTNTPLLYNRDEYTRFHGLTGALSNYNRGDLNLFYLPAYEMDSTWSGIINKAQTTELNSPYLSYLIVPVKNRIMFLYNSFFNNYRQFGSTTILDHYGNQIPNEGVVFWKYNNTLDFQQSRLIAENEVAIPYDKNQRNGFAIIRF